MAAFVTEYERVYDSLLNAIVSGRFQPGDKLPQRKVAESLGATTITLREAFRSLERDKLIVMKPQWGAMVAEITQEVMYGKYIVREALEGMAARLASQRITSREGQELLELAQSSDKKLIGDELSQLEKANLHYTLHEKIVMATMCDELISIIKQGNLYLILLLNAYQVDWGRNPPGWHTSLVEVILSGDADLAEATMREHVRIGYQHVTDSQSLSGVQSRKEIGP